MMLTPIPLRAAWAMAWRDRPFHLILIVFVALATAWNFVTPIFEAPDEPDHLQYVLFVADEMRRPDLRTDVARAGIEAPQPPLYYFALGVALRVMGIAHPFAHPTRNSQFSFERADSAVNYFIPFTQSYDYVRILRAFSTLFGVATLLGVYLAAIFLRVDYAVRLAATAVAAFLPQFTFISGAISNDSLTATIATCALMWLLYLLQYRVVPAWQWVVFGSLCGAAFLTKTHTVFLLPFGILMMSLAYRLDWQQIIRGIAWSSFGFLAVAGWYLGYNVWHYGDATTVNMQTMIVPELVVLRDLRDPYDWAFLTIWVPRLLFQSFLGTFGWMRIFLPAIFYTVYGIFWLSALLGTIQAMRQRRWTTIQKGLVFQPVLALLVIGYVNLTFIAPQGRYLFSTLGAISAVFILGLAGLPKRMGTLLMVAAPLFLLLTNLYSLVYVSTLFERFY